MIPGIRRIPTGIRTGKNTEKTWYIPVGRAALREWKQNTAFMLRGIRYASSSRFAPSVPYLYPIGIHACTAPTPYAMQVNSNLEYPVRNEYESSRQEESPQFLSVHIPKNCEGPLPVMVWFHGGGFKNGNADAPNYNYEYLVSEQKVIVAGINYRLGVFGFAADEAGNPGHPGPAGRDRRSALGEAQYRRPRRRPKQHYDLRTARQGGDVLARSSWSKGRKTCTTGQSCRVIRSGTMHNREEMERTSMPGVTEDSRVLSGGKDSGSAEAHPEGSKGKGDSEVSRLCAALRQMAALRSG